ncbi:phosphate ABC transporter substrate-binding protein PstS [Ramlibacter sp. G-1-2-2]|uniref:Phosphate-binding protein PstS n=1 Tax=Ramlibacter agri TaxID=2728837 RepID=A0A848H3X8_9BURK|nr:phosphate ABC transporter substrate-binding protein PstS [Ramlibacter agri]NML45495.1 phosphate ABC transporter substrate-binding protein PstS [Ramlibacter agri]
MKHGLLAAALCACLALVGCNRDDSLDDAPEPAKPLVPQVTGGGASFPAPLYARWAADYAKGGGAHVNYQSLGSAAGIRQVEAGTLDFAGSDKPLNDEELAKNGLLQFPTVIGGVVPVVNIAGIGPGQLRLNGQVLGDIYLGRLQRWNDPAIAALNPGLALPDAAIAPIRRADGSGSTFVFTNYLSKTNAEWKARVGEGTAVNWPAGAGGKGNEGVAAFVGRLPNSIGYVEYSYVRQNRMKYALLQNAAGQFVAPGDQSFQAAAAGADWNRSFYQVLTQQRGADAWPITGATFILLHRQLEHPAATADALRFFDWAYTHGDATAASLGYVPMPAAVKAQVRQLWASQPGR